MKSWLVLILFSFSFNCHSQDPQFSQYYAAPLLLNPALTGSSDCYRVCVNARSQWTGLPGGAFSTGATSIDLNVPDYRSGVGILLLHDDVGTPRLSSNEISGFYSFLVPASPQFNLRFGLQGTFVSRSIDYSRLIFEDQFSGIDIVHTTTSDPATEYNRVSYGDMSAGMVMYGEKTYWAGFAASHLTQPRQAFYLTGSRLPVKYSLHGGYNFHYSKRRTKNEDEWLWIVPTFNYKAQSKFDQIDIGLYLIKQSLMFGIWYRGIFFKEDNQVKNSDAVSVQIGYQYQKVSIGYSYDITTSKLMLNNTRGSHEISLIYRFCSSWPQKKKPMRYARKLPCPDFQQQLEH